MALVPSSVASNGKPLDLYFALEGAAGAPQLLSQSGNTISLSGGGGSVNVASATAVATSTQKLTAQTYNTGFNSTTFSGLVRSEGRIISEPPLGLGTAELNGGLAEVVIGAVDPSANPTIRFQKAPAADATIAYDASAGAFVFSPALPVPAAPDLAAVLAAGDDASGQPINYVGPIKMDGTTPSIKFAEASNTQAITNIAAGFANFWFLTVADTTGFVVSQTCEISGIDAVDGSLNPIVPSPFNTGGALGLTAMVQNVIAPSTIWISYSGVGAPNPPGPPTPVLTGAAQIVQVSTKTLIDVNSSGHVNINDRQIFTQNPFMYFRPAGGSSGQNCLSLAQGANTSMELGEAGAQNVLYRQAGQGGDRVELEMSATGNTVDLRSMITGGVMSVSACQNASTADRARIVMREATADIGFRVAGAEVMTLGASLLDLSGADIKVRSDTGSVDFFNAANASRASLNLDEATSKVSLTHSAGEVALDAVGGSVSISTDVDLILDGAGIIAASAGGNSGQHLRIKLNGVYYKIKLENDV